MRGEVEARGREAATLSRKPDGLTEHDSTVGWWATDGLFARSKPARRDRRRAKREKERESSPFADTEWNRDRLKRGDGNGDDDDGGDGGGAGDSRQ